jgi:hypothetical protein
VIQYTFDGAADKFENKTGERQNIFYACQLMNDEKVADLIDRLYNVFVLVNGKDTKIDGTYLKSIEPLKDTSLTGGVLIFK